MVIYLFFSNCYHTVCSVEHPGDFSSYKKCCQSVKMKLFTFSGIDLETRNQPRDHVCKGKADQRRHQKTRSEKDGMMMKTLMIIIMLMLILMMMTMAMMMLIMIVIT